MLLYEMHSLGVIGQTPVGTLQYAGDPLLALIVFSRTGPMHWLAGLGAAFYTCFPWRRLASCVGTGIIGGEAGSRRLVETLSPPPQTPWGAVGHYTIFIL